MNKQVDHIVERAALGVFHATQRELSVIRYNTLAASTTWLKPDIKT